MSKKMKKTRSCHKNRKTNFPFLRTLPSASVKKPAGSSQPGFFHFCKVVASKVSKLKFWTFETTSNIVLIPADNRPVSYSLPEQVGGLNKSVKIFLPSREFLGDLNQPADIEKILAWLNEVLTENKVDSLLVALDTIAYGGLVSSRRGEDSKDTILARLEKFKQITKGVNVLAYSSIMRISDSNVNEEEPEYWDKYGKLIFKYCHPEQSEGPPPLKAFNGGDSSAKPQNDDLPITEGFLRRFAPQDDIPPEILDDYLKRRQRNFDINKKYLKEDFDFLIYAKDDTAPFGLNVQEAELLEREIKDKQNVILQTGCDEMLLLLLTRVMTLEQEIKVFPIYSTPTGMNVIPRYEDLPLKESVNNLLKTCGLEVTASQKEADLILLLHTPLQKQNDFALGEFPEKENKDAVDFCVEFVKNQAKHVTRHLEPTHKVRRVRAPTFSIEYRKRRGTSYDYIRSHEIFRHSSLRLLAQDDAKPVILADVFAANGADCLLAENLPVGKLYGYAAWNTASNTIGTALAMGLARYIAEKEGAFSEEFFKKLLFTRLADDWAYQSITRQKIREVSEEADENLLYKEMLPLIKKIAPKFEVNPDEVKLSFPWGRTFEVEITSP